MGTQRSAGRRFDHDYGVTTQAILFLTDLDPDAVGDAGSHATHYEPVPVGDFRSLISLVPKDVIAHSTFVDVGAGMGRAVLLACEYSFARVTGIEVSPGLFEVARENIARASRRRRRCNDLRIVRADGRIWNYPPGDLVVFMYNPFDSEAMRATLGAVAHRRSPGATWLLYHTPVERKIIDDDPHWVEIGATAAGIVYRHD